MYINIKTVRPTFLKLKKNLCKIIKKQKIGLHVSFSSNFNVRNNMLCFLIPLSGHFFVMDTISFSGHSRNNDWNFLVVYIQFFLKGENN